MYKIYLLTDVVSRSNEALFVDGIVFSVENIKTVNQESKYEIKFCKYLKRLLLAVSNDVN